MRIVNTMEGWSIVPENKIEVFGLWLVSFTTGQWVERSIAPPMYKHLNVDKKEEQG